MKRLNRAEVLSLKRPIRYVGGEFNQCIKEKQGKVRICNAYSNLYEIGANNYKFNLIYKILNNRDDVWCERTFLPFSDFKEILLKNNELLFTLESKDELKKFDIISFNINSTLEYVNVLEMLELSDIDIYSDARMKKELPFVIGIMQDNLNVLPIKDYIDFFIFGDIDEVLNIIVDKYIEFKKEKLPKCEFLKLIKNVQGIYIPKIHKEDILIYGAKNEDKHIYDDNFLVPSMNEAFSETKIKNLDFMTASSRLRDMLDLETKTDDELLSEFSNALKLNKNICINFFVGIPTERYDDIRLSCNLINKIIKKFDDSINFINKNKVKINIKNYIIRPYTKFEWLKKNDAKSLKLKQEFIKDNIENTLDVVHIFYENVYISQLEQALLFVDDDISDSLYNLYKKGFVYYKSYTDFIKFNEYYLNDFDINKYMKKRALDYKFAYDNIVFLGTEKLKLKNEYKKLNLTLKKDLKDVEKGEKIYDV